MGKAKHGVALGVDPWGYLLCHSAYKISRRKLVSCEAQFFPLCHVDSFSSMLLGCGSKLLLEAVRPLQCGLMQLKEENGSCEDMMQSGLWDSYTPSFLLLVIASAKFTPDPRRRRVHHLVRPGRSCQGVVAQQTGALGDLGNLLALGLD